MIQGWDTKMLGEVCEKITRGISPKYIDKKGVVVLNQKCIRNHRIDLDPSRRHDDTVKKVSTEKFIKLGDVLVNSTGEGTLGRVAQVRELPSDRITVDSHVSIVRPIQGKFYLDFFGYAMIFIENEIEQSGAGASGQTELARTVLENNFNISFPKSHSEQRHIVSILDEAFAAIAKAKANAEQNLKNAKELFESYLQGVFENGNWEEKKLNEITAVKDGTHDSPKYIKEGIPFITQKNIRQDGLSFDDTKFITDVDHDKFYKRSNVAYGDILISMIGANRGMAAIVDDKRIFSIKNVGLIKVSENINNHFLLYYLKSPLAMKYVLYMSNGGAQEFVGLTALRSFPIPYPSLKEQKSIVQKLDALSVETKKLETIYQQKINDLEELKKSILQKAFSGELSESRIELIK